MMQRPAIIRAPFITPEELAEAYGLPRSHVTKLQKLLMESSKNRSARKKNADSRNSNSRTKGKKRSAKKTR